MTDVKLYNSFVAKYNETHCRYIACRVLSSFIIVFSCIDLVPRFNAIRETLSSYRVAPSFKLYNSIQLWVCRAGHLRIFTEDDLLGGRRR